MPVVMIILGSLVTALLAIGIVGGVILSAVAVFRLVTGRGTYNGKAVNTVKRVLISVACILNAFSLLVGGCFAARGFQTHKDEIWGTVEQKSQRDNILPDFMEDGSDADHADASNRKEVYLHENYLGRSVADRHRDRG